MPLAPQVANPGSRGQDSRYKFDPTFMVDLGGGIVTDGQYTYDMASNGPNSMLSLDRPSVNAGRLPPADDTDSVERYAASLQPGQGVGMGPVAPKPPAPPRVVVPEGEVEITPGFYGTSVKAAGITEGYRKKAFDELMRIAAQPPKAPVLGAAVGGHPPPLRGPLTPQLHAGPAIQPQTKRPAVLPAPVIPVRAPAPQPKPIVRIQPQTKKPAVILPKKRPR